MNKDQNPKNVLIIGGGFGGIAVAKKLQKSKNVNIKIISKNSFFEYYPALYKLVTGALAIEVCIPYDKIFRNQRVSVIQGEYSSYDKDKKKIFLTDGRTFEYDYLVLAMGSETNYFNIKGIEEFAFSFKSASEALSLKQHFLGLLQKSQNIDKEELIKRFHVTVVGGGPSGVELAGDITAYLGKMTKRYHIDPSLVTVDLIEANSRVLGMLPESVSFRAEARLRKLKVNLYTNRTLEEQDLGNIIASDMTIQSETVIWTAGTKINKSFNNLPLDSHKRVMVSGDFTLPNDNDTFIIGDGASAPGTGLAQGAISHGKYVGETISKLIKGKKVFPFKPKTMGYLVPIGHNWAVFSYKKITFSGFIPWIMRSFADFRYLFSIVSIVYVFKIFKQGSKYRKGKC